MKLRLYFVLIALLSCFNTFAANVFWIASSAGNWNTGTNWSTGAPPTAADVAVFNGSGLGNCTINVAINISGINIVAGYTGSITQSAGITITLGTSGYSQAAGSFLGGNSILDINGGSFAVSGGAFTSTSSILSVGGTVGANYTVLSITGGLFSHNNGTIQIDTDFTGCAQRTATLQLNSAVNFYNLIVDVDDQNCTEDILSVTGSSNVIVLNDFTHSDGFINTGTIEVRRDIYLLAGADGGNGVILVNHASNNQAYNVSGAGRLPHLRVNKTAGQLAAAGGTTTLLAQQFTLSSGTFVAPSGTFQIGGAWASGFTAVSITGGTFTHNSGTISIDPDFSGCAQRTATVALTSAANFYNLIVDVDDQNCTEDVLDISANNVIVLNDYTHTDGFVNTGTIEVRGDVYLQSGADGGTATILLNDPALDQEYFNTSAARFAHLRVNKAAGQVMPGAGTSNFYVQRFTLDAGTFLAPTGTFYMGGSWNASVTLMAINGGTFNHNTGTVVIDPDFSGCAQYTATLSLASPANFYNLTVDVDDQSCTEDILAVSGTSNVIVLNDFTHIDGFVNTGTVEVRGDVYLQSGADGGTATILLNDPALDQEYFNTSTARFAHFRVNKAAGQVTPGAGTSNFYAQQFTLDAGTFHAPTGTFYIGGPWNSSVTLMTVSGGTFNHNNGTISIDPDFSGCAQRTATLSITSSTNFYNLIVDVDDQSCIEDILAVSGTSNVVVLNDFTHNDGFVNTGTVEVRGDVYLQSGADGGTATILMNDPALDQEYFNTSTARFAHLRVNKAAGQVTPGAGTSDFYVQRFTIDAGTFNAPTGTLYIGGSWNSSVTLMTVSGGTFNHNSGTISIDPDFSGCAQYTATLSITSSTNFYNLTVDVDDQSCTEDILAVSGTSNVVVLNDFRHNDGFVNTGTVEVRGDVYLLSGADGGSATILMNDPALDQEYFNSSTARFPHLRVNKAAGQVSPGVGTSTFYVQRFTLDAGIFNAPTGTFYIGGPWNANITLMTLTGGTFNHNNGTINIDPDFSGCAQYTATISQTTTTSFYNLTVDVDDQSCTEDILAVSGSTNIIVMNDFVHNDGFVNTGTVEVRGDVYLQSGADGGSATILMNDPSVDQEYFNTSAARFAHLRINKAAGQVSPGAGTTNFLVQRFTLDAGTFNAPSGNFSVGGSWNSNITLISKTGGTFNHNNGTVTIDPDFSGCAQYTGTLALNSAVSFYNLTVDVDDVSCTEDIMDVTGSTNIIVMNDFVHNDGYVNTGTIEVRGDIYLQAGADGGTATILMNDPAVDQEYFNSSAARFAHLRINKAAGQVSPGVGTTTFLVQQFTLDAGTFNAPSGSFNVGGVWGANVTLMTVTSGTFNHNNGTLYIDPDFTGCTQRTATLALTVPITAYNLIIEVDDISCTEDILTATGSAAITAANTLTLMDGFVNVLAITAQGNVVVASTFDGGTGSLTFSGGNAQTFDLTGATGNFNGDVTLNKSSNNVTLLSACLLDAASQDLVLTQGNLITTSTNLLTIGDNVAMSGGSASGYIDGPIRKVGNDAFTFRTGKSGAYSPISIGAPSTLADAFQAEYFVVNPNVAGYNTASRDVTLMDVSTCDYWILDRTAGASSVPVTLTWNRAVGCYGFTRPMTIAVGRWDGTQWTNAGVTATTNSGTFGTVTSSLVSSFSPFTVVSTQNPLPIELAWFKVDYQNKLAKLTWETSTEIENDRFEIERSINGFDFEKLGEQKGQGTKHEPTQYTYYDEKPLVGKSYYRLKQVDWSGTFKYFNMVSLFIEEGYQGFQFYPNPVNTGKIFFSERASVQVFDARGILIHSEEKTDELVVNQWAPGLYLIRNQKGEWARLIIER